MYKRSNVSLGKYDMLKTNLEVLKVADKIDFFIMFIKTLIDVWG